jgi:hypothetical protein
MVRPRHHQGMKPKVGVTVISQMTSETSRLDQVPGHDDTI